MKLSDETIAVLKNFATINPNLVAKPGQKLTTIAESKTVMASADIVAVSYTHLTLPTTG